MKDCALVVVDMLYDFIDGSMACKNAEAAVGESLSLIKKKIGEEPAEGSEDVIRGSFPILFVCDSHPANHSSFTKQGGPWPPHCVAGTRGAEIHDSLKPYIEDELVFRKGENPLQEQYSGFEGINSAGQTLGEVLEMLGIKNVFVCGIATEYCVRQTCEDLKKGGFTVYLAKDALAYVDYAGHLEALAAMEAEGIRMI